MPAGAPITYPDEIFLEICARHAEGEDLLEILEENHRARPGMPRWSTFWERCCSESASEELSTAYARAHESWAHRAVAECARIANQHELGEETSESTGPKGLTTTVRRSDMLGHRKLKIDTRLWFAERVLTRYAKKSTTTLQNPDGSSLQLQPAIYLSVLPPPKEET